MYRKLLLLTLFIAACKQPKTDINSLNPAEEKIILYLRDSLNNYLHNMQLAEARKLLDSLQLVIPDNSHWRLLSALYRSRSAYYVVDEKFDSARSFINKSQNLALKYDSSKRLIVGAKIQIADILKDQKQYDSALHYAHEAYFLAKKVDTAGLPLICLRLSEINSAIGDLPAMRRYLFEGYRRSVQPAIKVVFTNNIASYYDKVDQTDSAILFLKAIEHDSTFSMPYYFAVKNENLGIYLRKKHKSTEGLSYLLSAVAVYRTLGMEDASTYFETAAAYRQLGDYATDKKYLDTAFNLAKPSNDYSLIKQIWQAKAENYKADHQSLLAMAAMDSAMHSYKKEVDSSIIAESKDIEARYQLRDKDEKIAALAFANEVTRKINQQQRIILFTVLITVLLIIVIAYQFWTRRQIKTKLREVQMQQQMLRSQMKSHFLFNAMGVLKSFIREDNPERAIGYLNNFSKLLRLSIENARHNFVPLKSELAALEAYLQLMSMESEFPFDYKIDVKFPYEEDDFLMPPMLLQPFTENAILHGFNGIKHKGEIVITIERDHHTLQCTIEDNGMGLKAGNSSSGRKPLSTLITQERLALLTKQLKRKAILVITDKSTTGEGEGIRIKLIFPFRNI